MVSFGNIELRECTIERERETDKQTERDILNIQPMNNPFSQMCTHFIWIKITRVKPKQTTL